MSTTIENIVNEVKTERLRQGDMWGKAFDEQNTPNDWVAFITRYVSEGAYDGWECSYTPERFRRCLVKAAALCCAAIETMDRQNGHLAPRHYDAKSET